MMQIKCKCVLLETQDKKSRIVLDDSGNRLNFCIPNEAIWGHQHLYILSNQEVIDGDWFLHPDGVIIKANSQSDHKVYNCPKVIASTDLSLGLPTVTVGFVKKYITQFNKDSKIEDILVEMEDDYSTIPEDEDEIIGSWRSYVSYKLKLSSQNEITIHPIQTAWSREEVEYLVKKAIQEGKEAHSLMDTKGVDAWLEKNL